MFGTLLGIGVYTVSYTIFVRGSDDDCINGIKGRDIEKVIIIILNNNNYIYVCNRRGRSDTMQHSLEH